MVIGETGVVVLWLRSLISSTFYTVLYTNGNPYTVENVEYISDPVDNAIKKFEFHPLILLIKNRIDKNISQNYFCFKEVTKQNY